MNDRTKHLLMILLCVVLGLALGLLRQRIAGAEERPALNLYVVEWHSPQPIDPSSIEATTTAGRVTTYITADGGLLGWVYVEAERDCLTVEVSMRSVTGIASHTVKSWQAACDRVYLPIVVQ
jgi:hypothetical protein